MRCMQYRQNTAGIRYPKYARWSALGCVVAVLLFASSTFAADWLAPAADQTVTAPWVKNVTAKLNEAPYRDVFAHSMGEPPHSAIVRYLNGAANAIEASNKPLAESYVDRTIALFDKGVRRGYYMQADVEPIKQLIRSAAESAMKGKQVATAVEDEERWAGYTQQKPLGLANEADRMKSEHSSVN